MKKQMYYLLVSLSISFMSISCGPNTTEADNKKAEETAKDLENIDYENVEMPKSEQNNTDQNTSEEDFDPEAMLD